MNIQTLLAVLPVYLLLAVAVATAGLTIYPTKKSVAQANMVSILVGSLATLFIKGSLPINMTLNALGFINIIALIAIILGLIVLNIVIVVKSK